MKKFIKRNPEHTRLPSERKLSEALGIDRVTVQTALQPFIDSGQILRCGNRGTFIASKKEGGKTEKHRPHPMLLQDHLYPRRTHELKAMLYENYLPHQEFWGTVIERFRQKNPETDLQIQWVPHDISHETYDDYVRNSAPDIVQTFLHPRRSALLSRLPGDFLRKLLSDDYCFEHLSGRREALFERMVPVYFSPEWVFLNRKITAKYKLEHVIEDGGLPEIMRHAPELVDVHLFWHYFRCVRYCTADGSAEGSLKMLEAVYDCYEKTGCVIPFSGGSEEELRHRFLNGKSLFTVASFLSLNAERQMDPEQYQIFPASLDPGSPIHSGTSCLGIYKDARNKMSALRFLEFIISEETQSLVPEILRGLAFNRAANLKYYPQKGILSEKDTAALIATTKSYYHMDHYPVSAICPETREYFYKFIRRELSRAEALELSKIEFMKLHHEIYAEWQLDNWHTYTP